MRRDGQSRQLIIGFAGLLCLIVTPFQTAEAFWFPRRQATWDRSRVVVVLPFGARRLRFGDGGYYYCRGRYYRHSARGYGYAVIPAPVGAVVPSLPDGHRTIVIDGITYHEYDGVYYKGGPAGYTVVPIAQATPSPATGAASASGQPSPTTTPSTMVINVPNKNRSFTPITLQSAGSGMYIGPQGEVYPTFPTIDQLRVMYGK